jgi:hypothetical protein
MAKAIATIIQADEMRTITTITDYCKEINISAPRYGFFDIRRFEDNMKTVNAKQSAFRHE